ncbi:radical SAM family heme chaperone HemW [Macrococcus equipercicus]|uniref:Heme chaperone HemW n=1 Tax=Macrococcus equipercicus TaxID=69967 RepID=A0A9Q9BNV7_9STAP|nr:radical SAM family heme chaperone HemW [Macrococcus equipercicus]KAA1040060.1 oxygen-independent coproporphyrinogen III oxidase [Macrococcus equipercicus]UTH12991.1 oxygen-independent coproporphyrinogen III oxidase [Macrococcus equipercicus]
MTSLYIHIPFCNRICTYCDFNKFLIKNQPVDAYIDCLIQELEGIDTCTFNTLFIGGGTPTALSVTQLERLLSYIADRFTVTDEWTMEANPDELTAEKIAVMKQYGVNRLSLGVQTFDNNLLKLLGRTHEESDIKAAVDAAKSLGIQSVSIDLMYHLPTQTLEQVKRDLDKALALNIDHISSYSLILEPKTQFYNQYRKGMLQLPDDTLAAEMYDYTIQRLAQSDFSQYELSNFAKPGHESRHNKVYWQNSEYYGAGAGSHGYINGARYFNIAPVPHYIKAMQTTGSAVKETHQVTVEESMEEFMFLGLRLNSGVSKAVFAARYNITLDDVFKDVLEDLVADGLLTEDNNYIALTPAGRMIGNNVFEKFLLSV